MNKRGFVENFLGVYNSVKRSVRNTFTFGSITAKDIIFSKLYWHITPPTSEQQLTLVLDKTHAQIMEVIDIAQRIIIEYCEVDDPIFQKVCYDLDVVADKSTKTNPDFKGSDEYTKLAQDVLPPAKSLYGDLANDLTQAVVKYNSLVRALNERWKKYNIKIVNGAVITQDHFNTLQINDNKLQMVGGRKKKQTDKNKKTTSKKLKRSPNPNIATKSARKKTKEACQATKKACDTVKNLQNAGVNTSCKRALKDCRNVLKSKK